MTQDAFITEQTLSAASLDPNVSWQEIDATQVFKTTWSSITRKDCTRIVCLSDTHGHHREIVPPKGDILIHGGDWTMSGEIEVLEDLCAYFQEIDFPTTVCIAGNHDVMMDRPYYEANWKRFHDKPVQDGNELFKNLMLKCNTNQTATPEGNKAGGHRFYYLEDESCSVPIPNSSQSIHIYGSPWTPRFYDWAFNVDRGKKAREIWSKIPDDTDVLITHGPPLGRGDLSQTGGKGKRRQRNRAGCRDLLEEVQQRVKPRLHIFGHIHEDYGVSFDGTTVFLNACSVDRSYASIQPCIVVDLPYDVTKPARIARPRCTISSKEELMGWIKSQGYTTLMEALEQGGVTAQQLPSPDLMVEETAEAYTLLKARLKCRSMNQLKVAQQELRHAMSQLYAESFHK